MRHSIRLEGNQNQGPSSDRDFWENVPNPVDIKREHSRGQAEAVVATQHKTNNNSKAFWEDTKFSMREMEHHAIPELPGVTPIPHVTVNSRPDAEAFPQELRITWKKYPVKEYLQWCTLMGTTVKVDQ